MDRIEHGGRAHGTTLRLIDGTPPSDTPGFTGQDLAALALWLQGAGRHGYRRVLIEAARPGGGPEEAGFLMVYAGDEDWAHWGIARQGPGIVAWACADGVDAGRFPTMAEALASLPPCRTVNPHPHASPAPSARLRLVHPTSGG